MFPHREERFLMPDPVSCIPYHEDEQTLPPDRRRAGTGLDNFLLTPLSEFVTL